MDNEVGFESFDSINLVTACTILFANKQITFKVFHLFLPRRYWVYDMTLWSLKQTLEDLSMPCQLAHSVMTLQH